MFEEKEKQTVKHIEDFYLLIGVCKPFLKATCADEDATENLWRDQDSD